jgi:trehalose 6-phosphate synthase/phosphatase
VVQSKELVAHLEDLLVGHPVDVVVGGYTVEIKPKGITKAEAVEQALRTMSSQGKAANLVVCIGDDRSDEDMFVGLESGNAATMIADNCKVGTQRETVTISIRVTSSLAFRIG